MVGRWISIPGVFELLPNSLVVHLIGQTGQVVGPHIGARHRRQAQPSAHRIVGEVIHVDCRAIAHFVFKWKLTYLYTVFHDFFYCNALSHFEVSWTTTTSSGNVHRYCMYIFIAITFCDARMVAVCKVWCCPFQWIGLFGILCGMLENQSTSYLPAKT